jgi:hypothetical protein
MTGLGGGIGWRAVGVDRSGHEQGGSKGRWRSAVGGCAADVQLVRCVGKVYNAPIMNLKLPRSYKLILSLVLIAGPFGWLVFTEDGQRRSDLFLLHVLGNPSFNIAYDRLNSAVTQDDIETLFPKVRFTCEARETPFGDQVCSANIASFNGLPADQARLYYKDDALGAMRLDYRKRYHELLATSLRNGLGEPMQPAAADLMLWQLDGGVIMLSAQRPETQADAALMWLSPQMALRLGASG